MKVKQYIIRLTENWPVKIICLVLAVFLSEFYRGTLLDKRYIIVPLTLKNRGELVPAEQYPRKVKIMIWGESNSIASIDDDDILAFIDISDVKEEGTYRLPIQTRFTNAAVTVLDNIEISADPSTLSLKLEKSMRKQVPIILSLKGIPADGYEVNESSIDPPMTEIEGPLALVKKIDMILTEPLSIEARTNGFSGTASIVNTENLISILGRTQVQYTVKINETITKKRFENIPIYFEKNNSLFSITAEQKTGSVEIQGPKKILENWSVPENILTVSCESVTESGIHTVPVVPILSAGNSQLKILRFNPKSVQITAAPLPIINLQDIMEQ